MSHHFQQRSGLYLDPFNPTKEMVNIEDGLLALARTARFRGQTTGKVALSVLRHSVNVDMIVSSKFDKDRQGGNQLASMLGMPVSKRDYTSDEASAIVYALLHDIGEWPFGDIPTPMKRHPAYEEVAEAEEKFRDWIVEDYFGVKVSHDMRSLVERADRLALAFEAETVGNAVRNDPHWSWLLNEKMALIEEFSPSQDLAASLSTWAFSDPPDDRDDVQHVAVLLRNTVSLYHQLLKEERENAELTQPAASA